MTQPSPHDRLPISVITGFLGAGKSTLLGKLIQHADMDRVAVIVNEFGEVGIDHALVSKVDEETVLLNSGCLCCTVRGDLLDTLKRLVVQREEKVVADFDRVLVETTGLADPAPILHTMMSDPFLVSRFRLDGVITVVDAANAAWQMDNHGEAIKQAAVADRLVLSKADLASAEARAATERRLAALNPAAPILPAVQGDLAPGQLFDAGLYNPATNRSMWPAGCARRPTATKPAMSITAPTITGTGTGMDTGMDTIIRTGMIMSTITGIITIIMTSTAMTTASTPFACNTTPP